MDSTGERANQRFQEVQSGSDPRVVLSFLILISIYDNPVNTAALNIPSTYQFLSVVSTDFHNDRQKLHLSHACVRAFTGESSFLPVSRNSFLGNSYGVHSVALSKTVKTELTASFIWVDILWWKNSALTWIHGHSCGRNSVQDLAIRVSDHNKGDKVLYE